MKGPWEGLSRPGLEALAGALAAGRLSGPYSPSSVARHLPNVDLADALVGSLAIRGYWNAFAAATVNTELDAERIWVTDRTVLASMLMRVSPAPMSSCMSLAMRVRSAAIARSCSRSSTRRRSRRRAWNQTRVATVPAPSVPRSRRNQSVCQK